MAANASNIATKHILDATLYLTLRTCENISLRIADMLEFPLTKESLINNLNVFNVSSLEEVKDLNLFEFGLFLELEPEEEEKAMLEQNIQMALQQNQIFLEDAIDIREIRNIALANQVLKYKRIKKEKQDQVKQKAIIQKQAEENAKTAEKVAMAEVQKQQAIAEQKIKIEQAKSQFEIQRMQNESQIKRQLMQEEFNFNMQLAQMNTKQSQEKEKSIEDRKDKRTKIQASQQSQMINQRQNDTLPTDFESAGNDNLGGFGLEQFEPQ